MASAWAAVTFQMQCCSECQTCAAGPAQTGAPTILNCASHPHLSCHQAPAASSMYVSEDAAKPKRKCLTWRNAFWAFFVATVSSQLLLCGRLLNTAPTVCRCRIYHLVAPQRCQPALAWGCLPFCRAWRRLASQPGAWLRVSRSPTSEWGTCPLVALRICLPAAVHAPVQQA